MRYGVNWFILLWLLLINTQSQDSVYLSRSSQKPPMCPCSLPAVPPCLGMGGRERIKPGSGSRRKLEEDRVNERCGCFQLRMLTSFYSFPVFTAFAVWCRSTWRKEMNSLLTKFSTRKLVSHNFLKENVTLLPVGEREETLSIFESSVSSMWSLLWL